MTPLWIFAADLHLARCAWPSRPDIHGDAYFALLQIVQEALRYRVPLLLGGDLFDKARPEPEAVAFMSRQMELMAAAGLPVLVIEGQHERVPGTTAIWMETHRWPTHLHQKTYEISGFKVYGLDWQPAAKLPEALDQIPGGTDVLMCHQVWHENMLGLGSEGQLTDIPHVHTVLTGDYHVRKTITTVNKQNARMHVYSPGSTCMRAIDEDPKKFCLLFSYGPAGLAATDMELRGRYMIEKELTDVAALERFIRTVGAEITTRLFAHKAVELPEELRKPLLRVTYREDLPEAYQRISQAVGDAAHIFWNAIPVNQETQIDITQAPAGSFDDLLSACAQLAPTDGPLYPGLQRLLTSTDPAAEIARMQAEFFATSAACPESK